MRPAVSTFAARGALWFWSAGREAVEDRIHRDAAQIAFFALLSFVPLAMLLTGAFGLVADDDEVRRRVVSTVFESIPLSSGADRVKLEASVLDALTRAGRLGPVAILLLVVAASGVMGALRHTINVAWDIEDRPPLLRRKALDVALVAGGTVVLLLSLSVSATRWASSVLDDEDGGGWLLAALLDVVGELLPIVFAAAVLAFLYKVLPTHRPRLRDVVGGAVLGALGLAVVRAALELYFEHLTDFGALYGSLGALMALLLFTYAAALVVLFGAELASEWSRLPGDDEARRRVAGALARVRRAAP